MASILVAVGRRSPATFCNSGRSLTVTIGATPIPLRKGVVATDSGSSMPKCLRSRLAVLLMLSSWRYCLTVFGSFVFSCTFLCIYCRRAAYRRRTSSSFLLVPDTPDPARKTSNASGGIPHLRNSFKTARGSCFAGAFTRTPLSQPWTRARAPPRWQGHDYPTPPAQPASQMPSHAFDTRRQYRRGCRSHGLGPLQ